MLLSFIIGYDSVAIPMLREVLKAEAEEHGFEFYVTNDESPEIEKLRNSKAVFIYSRNLAEEVLNELPSNGIIIAMHSDQPVRCRSEVLLKAREFWLTGGEENLSSLVHLILRELGFSVEVPEVKKIPWHGIYHPELGVFESVEEYLQKYEKRPLVGILFYRNHMIYKANDYVDELINALEKAGLGAIAVFSRKYQDEYIEIPSIEESIRKFFFFEDRPIIDLLVNLTYFSLLKGKNEVLKELCVPVLSPIASFYQSLEEWLKSDSIDYLSQVYNVIMPEIDGLIEPIAYSFAEFGEVKKYKPFKEHAELIARRIKRWVDLRRKKASERRIAIVLINPPCKGLEASVGVGFGLDVPESVVRLLNRLKELGYEVGDVPKDGNELIRLFLERKAISEFRWTSVEEIVAKGGAIGFVELEKYREWIEELPEDAKRRLIEDWGAPEDVLAKRVRKEFVGMVYDGKFVIPGLRFGNVAIVAQPKFGCAGSVCDGRVCRILHNPTITPPHQWLAVYRWLTRIFKADVVIHFGTHGYLEFRPGKGVGLSPSCWPEISVDDSPHLYVYAVSNPMEGVIAKRRSYATLIDHLYPPMTMAEVFDEIEALLNQYAHAKSMGDELRAEKIFEELLKKAESTKIPLMAKEREKVIEEIHRYVSTVLETQIELGLRVFGEKCDEKAFEYVITAMANDNTYSPSIRRVLAEELGLDYEELRAKPLAINSLGMTNFETLKLMHRIAVEVLKKLVAIGARSENLTDELLKCVLREVMENAGIRGRASKSV